MKKKYIKGFPLLLMWSVLLACALPTSFLTSPTAEENPSLESINIVTATPIITGQEVLMEPTVSEPAQDAATQSPTSIPWVAEPYSPKGVLVSGSSEGMLQLFNGNGDKLGDIPVPGYFANKPNYLHAYGLTDNNPDTLSILYYVADGSFFRESANGQVRDLSEMKYLASMRGLEGKPFVMIGNGAIENDGIHTELLSGDFSQVPAFRTYLQNVTETSLVYAPLYVIGEEGQAQGVWWTKESWAVGGAMMYPLYRGLYNMDVASGNTNWLFNDEYRPNAISRDGQIAAIVHVGSSGAGNMSIYHLNELYMVAEYPTMMGQDLGAGFGVISPDNKKVAWMEGGGEIMAMQPTFHSLLCFADIVANAPTHTIPATDIVTTDVVDYPSSVAKPLGWLNADDLLIEAYTLQEPKYKLIVLDTNTGEISAFAAGEFIGFVY